MGKAPVLKIPTSAALMMRKRNRILLSTQEKFLNFNANRLIGDTSSSEKIIVILTNPKEVKTGTRTCSGKNINAVRKIAFAGVGSPMNESLCRVSTLNLANRKEENTAIKIEM